MPSTHILLRSILVVIPLLAPACADAAGGSPDFVAACDNGRRYPIEARAVSDQGDLVTGYLVTGHRRSAHLRLVPMGIGYRYAARGLWLDGLRSEAVLHLGKSRAVSCTVTSG
jgi:hypothetical protein